MKVALANPGADPGANQVIQTTQQPETSSNRLEGVTDSWERTSPPASMEAQYTVDQESHRTVITVRDSETGQIIREIPPEKARELSQSIQKILGRMMDKRA